MRLHRALIGVALLALPSYASTVTLDFEGLQDSEAIGNYYNNGYGGLGSGPGPSDGITFSADAIAVIQTNVQIGVDQYNDPVNGTGLFGGEPTPVTAMMFCGFCNSGGTDQTIDVAGGFSGGFSLYYTAPISAGQVDIWSGLDGTGTDLGTLILPTTAAYDSSGDGGCDEYGAASDPGAIACPFVPVSISFSGTAESVVFTGAADYMYFDDVTFGSSSPSAAPEPATWLLAGLALSAVFPRGLRRARG